MSSWLNDLRYAIRVLLKHRSFSVMSIAILAIAIGANTAIFSVVRAVLLDPLPYPDASKLVVVWQDAAKLGFPKNTPAPGDYADWKSQNSVFEGMGALRPRGYSLTGTGEPERLQAEQVTSDLFSVLEVAPILGRPFRAEDDHPDSAKVAILSAELWKTRFGSAPNVIGAKLLLDGVPHEIVGVMPAGFDCPWSFDSRARKTQIWTPIALSSEDLARRDMHYLSVFARMKTGVSIQEARQQIAAIAQHLAQDYPETNASTGVVISPLREEIVGETKTAVLLLLAITGCVLLIASANLANLLLARAIGRQREIGMRIALGARRTQLVRQLFTENAVVSAAGVFLGLVLAVWTLEFLVILIPKDLPVAALTLNRHMLLFAFALGVVTTFVFGAVPARQAWRLGIVETLGLGGSRSGEHRSTHRMRDWLVVSQMAFTFVLLVAGGLMLRTLVHLRAINPGFQGENVLHSERLFPSRAIAAWDLGACFIHRCLNAFEHCPASWRPALLHGFRT